MFTIFFSPSFYQLLSLRFYARKGLARSAIRNLLEFLLQNPLDAVSELHKVGQSPDLEALTLWKVGREASKAQKTTLSNVASLV